MILNNKELRSIKGGASITGALVNSLLKGINTFMDVGRYLGSSIRRIVGGKSCPLR